VETTTAAVAAVQQQPAPQRLTKKVLQQRILGRVLDLSAKQLRALWTLMDDIAAQ
jgi:hypothetical protein